MCRTSKLLTGHRRWAPFWGAVIKSALSTQGFSGLFKAGWTTIKVKTCLDCALQRASAVLTLTYARSCMDVLHLCEILQSAHVSANDPQHVAHP